MSSGSGGKSCSGNNATLLSNNAYLADARLHWILNIPVNSAHIAHMKRVSSISAALIALLVAGPATAACYADYKAKKDDPLRLHYGVAEIKDKDCSKEAAKKQLAKRLEKDGWELLSVVDVFDTDGLDQREESAGTYFLRY